MTDLWIEALRLAGVLLFSYGGLREALAKLATPRPYNEGRFGEGVFGGGVGPWTSRLMSAAVAVRMLPADRQLTLTDHKRNAVCVVLGSALLIATWVARTGGL